eukprot:896877_1
MKSDRESKTLRNLLWRKGSLKHNKRNWRLSLKQRTLAMQLFHASGVFQMGQTTKEFQEALVSEVRDDEAVGDLHVEDIVGMRILSCLMAGSFSTREIASKVLLFHDGMAYLESLLAG